MADSDNFRQLSECDSGHPANATAQLRDAVRVAARRSSRTGASGSTCTGRYPPEMNARGRGRKNILNKEIFWNGLCPGHRIPFTPRQHCEVDSTRRARRSLSMESTSQRWRGMNEILWPGQRTLQEYSAFRLGHVGLGFPLFSVQKEWESQTQVALPELDGF